LKDFIVQLFGAGYMDIDFTREEHDLINHLISDPDFKKLQLWNQDVNAFQLNSMRETNHSRMIEWVLNPRESHCLGTGPLTWLLNTCWKVAMDQDEEERPDFFQEGYATPLHVSQMNLQGSVFFHEHDAGEYGYIDLLVMCPEEKLAIVVENKYGANETKGQLQRYKRWGEENLKGYNVLYLHMDGYEKWDGAQSYQWLKVSYDWLIEILKEAKDNESVPVRVTQLIEDYYHTLAELDLDEDEYFSQVKPAIFNLVKAHAKALEVMTDKDLVYIDDKTYISIMVGNQTKNSRLLSLYYQNYTAINQLIGWDSYVELEEYLHSNINGLDVEIGPDFISVHLSKWHSLQNDEARKWSLYLNFYNSKPIEDSEVEVEPTFDLKLQFVKSNFNSDCSDKLARVWAGFGDETFNLENINKTKSLRLESNMRRDKESMCKVVAKYIDNIESHIESF